MTDEVAVDTTFAHHNIDSIIHFAGLKAVGESVEKTPDIEELNTDGVYGSEDNNKKFEELSITHIQTAVRGRKNKVDLKIEETKEGKYEVTCPRQRKIQRR